MTPTWPGMMSGSDVFAYVRHRPERTPLYRLIESLARVSVALASSGQFLPHHVAREFNKYRECVRLENGFLRVRCKDCWHDHLVAFSCRRCGSCPGCGAKRMVETAALLVEDVLPHKPIHQWVFIFLYPLRFLLANNPQVMGNVPGIVNRASA